MVHRPADPFRDGVRGPAARRGKHLHRHQPRLWRHPGDALAVARALRHGARDVRAVRVVVARVVVVGDEVPSLHQAGGIEIVDGIDAGIDDGDGDALASAGVPRPLGARSLEVPLLGEVGIVRKPRRLVTDHRLRPDHVGTRAKLGEHLRLGARLHLQLDVVFGRERVAVKIVFLLRLIDHLAGHRRAPAQLDFDQAGHRVGAQLHHRSWSTGAAGQPEKEKHRDGNGGHDHPLAQGRTRAESAHPHAPQHTVHPRPTRRRPRYFAERAGIIPDLYRARASRRRPDPAPARRRPLLLPAHPVERGSRNDHHAATRRRSFPTR